MNLLRKLGTIFGVCVFRKKKRNVIARDGPGEEEVELKAFRNVIWIWEYRFFFLYKTTTNRRVMGSRSFIEWMRRGSGDKVIWTHLLWTDRDGGRWFWRKKETELNVFVQKDDRENSWTKLFFSIVNFNYGNFRTTLLKTTIFIKSIQLCANFRDEK